MFSHNIALIGKWLLWVVCISRLFKSFSSATSKLLSSPHMQVCQHSISKMLMSALLWVQKDWNKTLYILQNWRPTLKAPYPLVKITDHISISFFTLYFQLKFFRPMKRVFDSRDICIYFKREDWIKTVMPVQRVELSSF